MEEDSIEDGALKDYFEKGKKKREKWKQKERKRAGKGKAKEKEGDTSGKQGEENLAQRDPTKLTNLNPSKERISQNNQAGIAIHSVDDSGTDSESGGNSPFPTAKSDRSCKGNLDDEDDDFLDTDFTFTPERASPTSLELSQDTDMSEETKSNQQEGADLSQSQQEDQELTSTPPGDNDISQESGTDRQQELAGSDQVAILEGDLNLKGGPILTVEVFNEIAKASGESVPLFRYKTQSEFFKSKEANYLKEMTKFQNDDGSYTVSQTIANSIVLALEAEQRNRNYIYHHNEFNLSHLKGVLEAANFAKQVRDEVTKNISEHIIAKLNKPVEESQTKLEVFTKKILNKLDEHERILEDQKGHLAARGFLSVTREEYEAEVAGHRIIALQEDNDVLKSERDEMESANKKLKEQFEKLRGEKASWQTKYFELLAGKRPRDEQPDPSGKKHKPDDPISSPPPDIANNSISKSSTRAHTSNHNITHKSQRHNSSSSSSSTFLSSSGRGSRRNKEDPSDEDKERLRIELGLNYSPWERNLDRDKQAEVTLALWRRELRKIDRYVPDYGPEKLKSYNIEHERNIKFSMKAYERFRGQERYRSYTEWTEDRHDEYQPHQNRNHIPKTVGEYLDIINDPESAAFVRCIPIDYYYYQVACDTTGFITRQPNYHVSRKGNSIAKSRKELNQSSAHKISQTNYHQPHHGGNDTQVPLSALYTWGDESLVDVRPKKYSSEHLSLDEIAEVERLDTLVGQIRRRWPPGFYVALRDKEISNVKSLLSKGLEIPKWAEGLASPEVCSMNAATRRKYDDHQMLLIHARIVRITNTAAAQGEEQDIDGPSGQGSI